MNKGEEGEKGNDVGLYNLSVGGMYEDTILLYIQHKYSNVLLDYFGGSVSAVSIDFVFILYTEICHITNDKKITSFIKWMHTYGILKSAST